MPAMSGAQIADIAGGTLYSVIAILLALASRKKLDMDSSVMLL
jgi:crotonobetainyl-CoA:carnitine CoA-transferase CaiB-like acyl-CoA transferase